MRVVIADDEPLARELLRALLESAPDVEIVGEASDGTEAARLIAQLEPDAAFLDIDMPPGDGISAAYEISQTLSTDVVFVTAHAPYAVDAFEVGAADYLLKPVRRARLAQALDRLRSRSAHKRSEAGPDHASEKQIWVPTRQGKVRLSTADIIWIEAQRDHVLYHTKAGSFLHRERMSRLESLLEGSSLVRVHRSAFVSREGILAVRREGKSVKILVEGDRWLPVGPQYRKQLEALQDQPL